MNDCCKKIINRLKAEIIHETDGYIQKNIPASSIWYELVSIEESEKNGGVIMTENKVSLEIKQDPDSLEFGKSGERVKVYGNFENKETYCVAGRIYLRTFKHQNG